MTHKLWDILVPACSARVKLNEIYNHASDPTLMKYHESGQMLFDLKSDPFELENLFETKHDFAVKIARKIQKFAEAEIQKEYRESDQGFRFKGEISKRLMNKIERLDGERSVFKKKLICNSYA